MCIYVHIFVYIVLLGPLWGWANPKYMKKRKAREKYRLKQREKNINITQTEMEKRPNYLTTPEHKTSRLIRDTSTHHKYDIYIYDDTIFFITKYLFNSLLHYYYNILNLRWNPSGIDILRNLSNSELQDDDSLYIDPLSIQVQI